MPGDKNKLSQYGFTSMTLSATHRLGTYPEQIWHILTTVAVPIEFFMYVSPNLETPTSYDPINNIAQIRTYFSHQHKALVVCKQLYK